MLTPALRGLIATHALSNRKEVKQHQRGAGTYPLDARARPLEQAEAQSKNSATEKIFLKRAVSFKGLAVITIRKRKSSGGTTEGASGDP